MNHDRALYMNPLEITRMGFDPGSLQSILLRCIFNHEREWFIRNCSYIRRNPSPTPCPGGRLLCVFPGKACCSGVPSMIEKGHWGCCWRETFHLVFSYVFTLKWRMVLIWWTITAQYLVVWCIWQSKTPPLWIWLVWFLLPRKKVGLMTIGAPDYSGCRTEDRNYFLFVQGNPESNQVELYLIGRDLRFATKYVACIDG